MPVVAPKPSPSKRAPVPTSPARAKNAEKRGASSDRASSRDGSSDASISPPLPASAPPLARAMRTVRRLVQGLRIHNAFGAAPAMSFHFFLSLIPVLVLSGFILGQLVRKNGVEAFLGPVLETAPDAAEQVVRHELERLAGANVAPLAPLSVIGFLWLASSGTQGLMDVFELAVGAPRRGWWKQRAIALAWVLSALLAVAVASWSLVKADALLHRNDASHAIAPSPPSSAVSPLGSGSSAPLDRSGKKQLTGHRADVQDPIDASPPRRKRLVSLVAHSPWERIVALAALCVIALGVLASFYRFAVEQPPGVKRRAWPGAVVAFVAWLLVSWAFGEYVSSLGKYTLFYGSVAAVAVLLVWFYLTSWSLLLGAEVNAQLEGVRDAPRTGNS